MNKYHTQIHHRRSIRLKGHNYAHEGLYFITICCQKKVCLFGEISKDQMILNDAGKIANDCWLAIPNHFPNAILHEHIIMPNHVHGIIELKSEPVGAENFPPDDNDNVNSNVTNDGNRANDVNEANDDHGAKNISSPRSPSKTIGSIVRGFKIGVTKWMRQNTDVHDVWQRNYYEHIIRNEHSYNRISEYILMNPAKWANDKFCTKQPKTSSCTKP